MFLKKVKGGSPNRPRWYLQLAVSVRGPKGPRHKTLCTLGRYEELVHSGELKRLAQRITQFTDDALLVDLAKENLQATRLLGSILGIEKAFRDLQLDRKLEKIAQERKIRFDLVKVVKLMLLQRIVAPGSKLSLLQWRKRLYNHEAYEGIEAQHLYRAMDVLLEEKEKLKEQVYKAQLELFPPSLNVVFYDLTTLYFESEKEDELRRFGFSKDHKHDRVQVVLGLVLSEEGLPLDYEVFAGDTFEGKTVIGMVERLRERFAIRKVILVGDRGLVSEALLKRLEEMGCGYVVGARIKQLPEKLKEQILQERGWEKLTEDLAVKELEGKGRRLVVYRSRELQEYERQKRAEVVEWLREQLEKNPKRLLSQKGYRKYLVIEGVKMELDLAAIQREERLDGIFGFWCSREGVSKEQAYQVYQELWQIEEAFRSMKSHLKIRPVYHYKPQRVKAHILICYLAFCVMRVLERRLQEAGIGMSLQRALSELEKVSCVEIETPKGLVKVRTRIEGTTYELFRALHIKIPPVLLPQSSA